MAGQNITIAGATFNAVPSIDVPISGGGTASYVEISDTTAAAADVATGKYFYTAAGVRTQGTSSGGGGSWTWMGENPYKVGSLYSTKQFLKDTGFASWTPSTTATTLVSSANLSSISADFSTYDYIILYRFHTHFDYDSGASGKFIIDDWYSAGAVNIYGYCATVSDLQNNTVGSQTNNNVALMVYMLYKNNTGNEAVASTSYGVYSGSIPSLSLTSSSITPKTFQVSARCSSSYFSTSNASHVDKNTSYFEEDITLWRVDWHTSLPGGVRESLRDMWLNGF